MPRTYHFMGWNRDRDAEQPCLIAPLEPIPFIDEASAFSPAMWDAMTAAMVFGTGVIRAEVMGDPLAALEPLDGVVPRDAVIRTRVVRPEEMARRPEPLRETLRERHVRLWERPMFTLKDDDPQITWDHKAMAARPFRERKD